MPLPSPLPLFVSTFVSIRVAFVVAFVASIARHMAHLTAGAALIATAGAGAATAQTTVTDLAGRRVQIPPQVDRVLLGEGRLLPALGVLDADPTHRLVGMMGDFEQLDAAGFATWLARFPRLGTLPRIGRSQAGSFSDERALALRPQVAIFGLGGGHGPSERDRETLARMEAAGVAIVFVDFRHDPLGNTPRSMAVLGQVLGRAQAAAAFNLYYRQQLQRVQQRLEAKRPSAPSVFLESRVGLAGECCETMVGMLGKLLPIAGGRNIAQGLIPGESGVLNPELLLASQPEVYIGTAIGTPGLAPAVAGQSGLPAGSARILLGAGVTPQQAQASLRQALQRTPLVPLAAVREGRAHAIWHHFYNSPFNVVAVQVMAKWLHPTLFTDLDPRQTLDELARRFQPVPWAGEYWTSLAPAP